MCFNQGFDMTYLLLQVLQLSQQWSTVELESNHSYVKITGRGKVLNGGKKPNLEKMREGVEVTGR